MRCPKYLSPTSLKLFESDPTDFYIKYLADIKLPNMPQTKPMAAGSAFDAYAKSFLYKRLVGENGKYEFDALFCSQVEIQNRDWALDMGRLLFDAYKRSGALADMMVELETATATPRMEFWVEGLVNGVPIAGKPDIYFISQEGARVILDWKCNGACATKAPSPAKGYVTVRDSWQQSLAPASRNRGAHKDATLARFRGVLINTAYGIEEVNDEWALQCCIYAWSLGEEPGSESLVVGIDQLCGPPPLIRIASHRLKVGYQYQMDLVARLERTWAAITSMP